MDQAALVRDWLEDGRKFVDRLHADHLPLDAAGWLKTYDDAQDYLYVVTPAADPPALRDAVSAIRTVYDGMPELRFGLDVVRPVGPRDAVGRWLVDVVRSYPGRRALWVPSSGGSGSLGFDGPAYVYTPVAPAPAG